MIHMIKTALGYSRKSQLEIVAVLAICRTNFPVYEGKFDMNLKYAMIQYWNSCGFEVLYGIVLPTSVYGYNPFQVTANFWKYQNTNEVATETYASFL